jgi:hypothetical protein
MQSARIVMLGLAAGLAVGSDVQAQDLGQRRPIEIGMDAALSYESADDISQTAFTLPVPRVRIGFFVSEAISLEPIFSLQYARTKDDDPIFGGGTSSFTQYDLAVGLLYHFSPDRTRSQVYLRPFAGIRGFSGEDDSASQPMIGAGLGLKFPATNRLGTRLEAGFTHRFEDEPVFNESNQLFLAFGLSFFTR